MRLSNSILIALLFSIALFPVMPLYAADKAGQEMPAADLAKWMQKGEKIQRAMRWNPDELLETAQVLANAGNRGVGSEKGAAALLLSGKLYAKAGSYSECITSCLQLLDTYPREKAASEACELAGTAMADQLGKTLEAAELFENRALTFPNESQAERFFQKAFSLYEAADAWSQASDCGQRYLDYFADSPNTAHMRLELARIWLKQGKSALVENTLRAYTRDYKDDPHTIIAHQILSKIYASEGNTEQAYQEDEKAWACYERHHKQGNKMASEMHRAAAQALYDLQTPRRADFRRACEFMPNAVSDVNPKPMAQILLNNYDKVMQTDAYFAPKALVAQGNVSEELGNFLLQQGYVQFAESRGRSSQPPHTAAMEEYKRAIAYYERAYDYGLLQGSHKHNGFAGTPEFARLMDEATTRSLELRLGNGDLVFGWALQLQQTLPSSTVTTKEIEARFASLNENIYPVLMEGLALYEEAHNMAVRMEHPTMAERARGGLSVPFAPFADDLLAMNREAWDATRTAAQQIVGSIEMSKHAATAAPQYAQLETAYTCAVALSEETSVRTREVLMALRNAHAEFAPNTSWEDKTLEYYNNYATFCREVATKLDGAVSQLKENRHAEKLQGQLRTISRNLAAQEYQNLEEAYDLCEELAITSPGSDKILVRLVALNPKEYREKAETHFGTRQKP